MNEKKIVILYGSQSGNSQDIAERIWRRTKTLNINSVVSSFDHFDLNNLFEKNLILVCVCSTTGQGDVPDNMTKFWKMIMRKSIPNDLFEGLDFFTIGLGDTSYEKFNFTAKKLHKRLIQLGASSPAEICLCDEQHPNGTEGAYSKWIQNFWKILENFFTFNTENPRPFIHKFRLEYPNQTSEKIIDLASPEPANEIKPFYSKLVKNERVTHKDHWQNVRLLEFDCNTERIKYDPGDVLVMRPSNTAQNVHKFLETFQHLNLNLEKPIKIVSNYPNEFELDNETDENLIKTIGDLVFNYLDLNSIPKQSFFEVFFQISQNELEKEKLEEFLTPEGQEDLFNYIYRPRRTIAEVFFDFPNTCKSITDLETLLDLIPAIKPRSFSIASSPHVHKDRIQLLVAVVEYKTRLYETRKGTCSYWLSQLDPNNEIKIPVWIKKGSFKIDFKKPLICVGPGTGVAPFRSLINERVFKYNLGDNHLYFGCRSKFKDFYFENEWKLIADSNHLFLHPAFSRDQEEKVYVQDLMLNNSDEIFDLIHNRESLILIAGNSKRMPEDILATLEKIIKQNSQNLGLDETDQEKIDEFAKKYVDGLALKNRLQMETWS
ncbi:NADPH-dependent diflavin oxidoreductase 1 [Brachionus plicatilis]|uniref:NADPH-dependent diflavin oxidoreductase 1 n=1 Tax=Brachionus plicatilis TaxID=10195 RepID=A0A3M7RNX4_BRAPC|nr:NADPH-dependent diflavin oxidoreductase 1 [Brachionus plicatilis]